MISRSLPLRVLVVSFIVVALPLLIDSFIFFQNAYKESLRDAKQILRESANYRAFAISELDPVRQVLLKELIILLGLEKDEKVLSDLGEQLKKIKEVDPDFDVYILEQREGGQFTAIASSQNDSDEKEFKPTFLFERVLAKGTEGDFLQYRKIEGKDIPYIYVLRKIESEDPKTPLRLLMISSRIDEDFSPMLRSAKERNLNINFAVLTKDEVVFTATDLNLIGQMFSPLSVERQLQIQEAGQFGSFKVAPQPLPVIQKESGSFFEFIFKDKVQIAYQTEIPKINLFFLAYATKQQLFSQSINHFLLIYTIYALIFVLGGAFTYWLTSWFSRPLRQLTTAMERVGKGDLDVRFKEEPLGFEINSLGTIFNHTLDALFENIKRAEDERVLRETYQKELELGQEVQKELLPKTIREIPGIEISAAYLPSKEVGGDFYDIFLKENGSLILTVADAAGRGISSCLYALEVRSLLRTYSTLFENVGDILSETNNIFLKDVGDSGMFVTVFMCRYDPETRSLHYYSCGHVPGIVRKADGRVMVLAHVGMALGLKESAGYKMDTLQLERGDILLLYTDGFTEAVNEKNQHFTEQRLKNLLQRKNWDTPEQLVNGLQKEIEEFTKATVRDEEITLLCMKVL